MLTQRDRPKWRAPRIDRRRRWLGGAAAAIAAEVGVQPIVIRAAFVFLAFVGGSGLVLYALCWAGLTFWSADARSPYVPEPKGANALHRHFAIAMIVLGIFLLVQPLASDVFDDIVWPIGFVLTGGLIAWSRSQFAEGISIVARLIAGVLVAIGGITAFAALQFNIADTIVAFIFAVAIFGGIAVVAAPSLIRMAQDLDAERLERTRADEKARISAHLHDSVLQTLNLIQRNATDPTKTTALARNQERELRNWLYGDDETLQGQVSLAKELEKAAAKIEERHGVIIEVVAVGNQRSISSGLVDPIVAAASEAMSNAANHSEAKKIDVFAELTESTVQVFVRDTGIGFVVDAIDPHRRGISDSLIGRMHKAGGSASIVSAPGEGTEVELTIPLDAQSNARSNSVADEQETSQ